MAYPISQIYPSDRRAMAQVDELLDQEGIQRDKNLDYTCGMYDDNGKIIATGSCFGSTLRCFAVDHTHQGEGLLNEIITELINYQFSQGNIHLFLYTKPGTAKFFGDLGFYQIAGVPERLVFMENRRNGFSTYLSSLLKESKKEGEEEGEKKREAALIMNANPFTLGHQFLAETAAAACDRLHLFVVSEDRSLVPYKIRKKLIQEGTKHLSNVILHDCGPYMISSATFPSYFLKDETTVIESQARLDIAVFTKIAKTLGIERRFVGEEPTSLVTGLYNKVMVEELPREGIECTVVPRKTLEGEAISASTARTALQAGDMDTFKKLVPETTYAWFTSAEAAPVLERIRRAGEVRHY